MIETTILILNLVLALAAFATNSWASTKIDGWLGKLFFATAVLAMCYAGAYFWLVFNLTSAAQWSMFVRPIGLFSWPMAWLMPPIIVVRYFKRRAVEVQERTERIIDEVRP